MNKYGSPYRIWLGTHFLVFITEPEDFKIILTNPSSMNKLKLYDFFTQLLGDSILTEKNSLYIKFLTGYQSLLLLIVSRWKRNRKSLETTFNITILKSFIPIFEKHSQLLCDSLAKMVGKGVFDVNHMIYLRAIALIRGLSVL